MEKLSLAQEQSFACVQDMLRTSYLQKKARLIEKAGQGELKDLPSDTVLSEKLAVEAAQTDKLVSALQATIAQSQNAPLQNLLLEAQAIKILHK